MLKISSFLLPLLLIGGTLLGGCRGGDATPPLTPVVLIQPAAGAPSAGATYTGEVRARHEVDLAFRVGGKIAARLVDAGAEIKVGQPLARLDPADLQLAASSARAQLASAESELANARAEHERYAGLLAKKFVSQATFDAKDNAFNGAQARLEQARAQNQISGNQAAYGTLSSETSAVVTAVLADTGQVVAAGQPVLRVARPEEKEVAIAVPESRLAEIRTAKEIRVGLWAAPATVLTGELRELSPAADQATRTYAARIRLIAPPPEVRLGMTARVQLGGNTASELLVPLGAVIDIGGGPFVRVVKDGKVVSRPVSIASFREDGAAISSGLQTGEAVIVSGAAKLVDGQAVQARPLTPPDRQR
ncbi:MAG: efflux RND transporter periplasmic adaptor subunit [Betaproteobacteria bacterium]|nr:efflux RND transporter periplasmic adaptor subunit [Betaproteobacteria bacterium]